MPSKRPSKRLPKIDNAWPLFRRTLGRFFWTSYDHLGRLVFANMCAAAIVIAPLAIAGNFPKFVVPGVLMALVLCAILQTALTAYALEMRRFQDPDFGRFWVLARRHWATALKAHGATLFGLIVFAVNVAFWARPPEQLAGLRIPCAILAGLSVWGLAFVLLCYLFLTPLMIDRGFGVFGALKRSALLTLDNTGVALLIGFVVALIEIGGGMTVFGLFTFCMFSMSTMSAALYTTVLYKYDRLERRKAEGEAPQGKPTSWKEILERGGSLPGPDTSEREKELDVDGEPIRMSREIWRPWEQ